MKNQPSWQKHDRALTQDCWYILPYSSRLWQWKDITAPSPAGTPLFQFMDGHPLSSVECRWHLIHRLLHHAGSTCTTHTVFTLGLQPPLPLPMKSSNLGVGEAKCINATHDLPASFNTTGLTGIVKLSGCHLIHSTHWLALFTPLQPRDGVEFSPSLRAPSGLRNPNLCTYHADLTVIPYI